MTVTRTSIPRPDVQVTITQRTVTPTVATPTLPACIVGPCYQVVDPQLSGSLAPNPDAMIQLPAMIRGHAQYTANTGALVSNVTVTLNINGTAVSHLFTSAASPYTPAQIVTALNTDILAANASAVAELIGVATSNTGRFVLRTTGVGTGNYITWAVTDAGVGETDATAFATTCLALPRTWRADGQSVYDQTRRVFGPTQYPDPLDIIA